MSLLGKIQARTAINATEEQGQANEAGFEAELNLQNSSILTAQPRIVKKDLIASFRDLRRNDTPRKQAVSRISKHQELKNRLHRLILSEIKDNDVESIVTRFETGLE